MWNPKMFSWNFLFCLSFFPWLRFSLRRYSILMICLAFPLANNRKGVTGTYNAYESNELWRAFSPSCCMTMKPHSIHWHLNGPSMSTNSYQLSIWPVDHLIYNTNMCRRQEEHEEHKEQEQELWQHCHHQVTTTARTTMKRMSNMLDRMIILNRMRIWQNNGGIWPITIVMRISNVTSWMAWCHTLHTG